MAKKIEVEGDARQAAIGCFNPTDDEFVGENNVRAWSEDDAQLRLSENIVRLTDIALEVYGYRSNNKVFRVEFGRKFRLELRKFYITLPDVREAEAIHHVKWEVEYAISQGDDAAKKLAEKLSGDDAGHALEWSTGFVTQIAKGDVGRQVKKLVDRIGENLDSGRPCDFAWLADVIVRIAIQEAARISHGSNEMNFLVEFYRVKAWGDFARNVQTQLAINRQADES